MIESCLKVFTTSPKVCANMVTRWMNDHTRYTSYITDNSPRTHNVTRDKEEEGGGFDTKHFENANNQIHQCPWYIHKYRKHMGVTLDLTLTTYTLNSFHFALFTPT